MVVTKSSVLLAVVFLPLFWLVSKTISLLRDRQKYKNLPGPPWHPIMGHLIAIGKTVQKLPQRAHPHLLVALMSREYDLPGVFFMDTRPAAGTVNLIVADPEAARQVSESDLPKHPSLGEVIEPLAGRHNILSTDGAFWKKWRSIFNPGFSIQQVVSQVSSIVECGEIFIKLLDEHAAAGRVFRLEEEVRKNIWSRCLQVANMFKDNKSHCRCNWKSSMRP